MVHAQNELTQPFLRYALYKPDTTTQGGPPADLSLDRPSIDPATDTH